VRKLFDDVDPNDAISKEIEKLKNEVD